MSSTPESVPGPLTRAAAETVRENPTRRWNYSDLSDRLNKPLRASDDSPTLADACRDMAAIYKSERINGYSGGHVVRARRWYCIAHDASRHIRRTEDDYSVALVTLRGQTRTDSGEYRPHLDYRDAIMESWSAVKYQLDEIMRKHDGIGYFRVTAGNGDSAYAHVHIVLFVRDTDINRANFGSVREAHVSNSPVARDLTHDNHVNIMQKEDISFEARNGYDRTRGAVDPATKYVASQIPHIGGLSQPDEQLEHSAVCTQTRTHDVMMKQSLRDRADSERRERELGRLRALAELDRTQRVLGDPLDSPGIQTRFDEREPESNSLLHVFCTKTHVAKLDMVRSGLDMSPSERVQVRMNPTLRSLLWLYLSPVPPD